MSLTICVKYLENSKNCNESIVIPLAYQHIFIKALNIQEMKLKIDFIDLDILIANVEKSLDVYVSNSQPKEHDLSTSKITFNRIKKAFNDIIVIAKNAQSKQTSIMIID